MVAKKHKLGTLIGVLKMWLNQSEFIGGFVIENSVNT